MAIAPFPLAFPPANSKYNTGLTPYEIEQQRRERRNAQARLRMAKKREQLKLGPPEEQALAAARNKEYQATYRQKNRKHLSKNARARRQALYRKRYGPELYLSYEQGQRERARRARAKRRAQAGFGAKRT
ncbi:hypothetical protein DFH06DRAFT_1337170 [Mycena polygramma]|nr:hypothetical protein DFH06DRAFT_1337170 [Mycena polygramma]